MLEPPTVTSISEDAFHRARGAATAPTNTCAGETFLTPVGTYVRINDRHFLVAPEQPHVTALSLVGQSPDWRHRGGR